jgi:uncharacterized protein (TIGR03382 family)
MGQLFSRVITVALFATFPAGANAILVDASTSTFLTHRDCTGTGTALCDSISATVNSDTDGLPGATSTAATLTDPNYGTSSGTVTLGGAPGNSVLTASSDSLAAKRNGSNNYALERYTNSEAKPIALIFRGIFNYEQTVPAENANFDPRLIPSFAEVTMGIYTIPEPAFDAGTTEADNFFALSISAPPGTILIDVGLMESTRNLSDTGTQTLKLSAIIQPGESVWLRSTLSAFAANGAVVGGSLATTASAVPTPGSLPLLALGLLALVARRYSTNLR